MNEQQNPDGSWSPAQPLGWQGHGIDWECYLTTKPLKAEGYDEDMLVSVVTARTRRSLNRKMRREEKRLGLPRNGVL